MRNIDKVIEILQAAKEGKTIEVWQPCVWKEFIGDEKILIRTIANTYGKDYLRVKPQPTYRPYANAEEFLKASKEHGPYIWYSNLEGMYAMPTIINSKGITLTKNDESYDGILNYCKWQDGTPCGILEQ